MLTVGMIKLLFFVVGLLLSAIDPAIAQKPIALTGPLVDPEGLLSDRAADDIRKAAVLFKEATGHWMVFVVTSSVDQSDFENDPDVRFAPWEVQSPRTPVGIVFSVAPSQRLGSLVVVPPHWRSVAAVGWIPMFPQRLLQKYGEEPFERRAVKSAEYLAAVFPDKIKFLLKPDTGPISEESTEYARTMMKGIEYFCYFIILFTFYRTFLPARVRDEDTDEFSNELRRLKRERQIW